MRSRVDIVRAGHRRKGRSARLKDGVQGYYLARFVRFAHVEQHALARVVLLATDDGNHVARFAFERGRNGITAMIPDLGGAVV